MLFQNPMSKLGVEDREKQDTIRKNKAGTEQTVTQEKEKHS